MRAVRSAVVLLFTALVTAQVDPVAPPQGPIPERPERYDPLRGMDADGRIPKPEFPADLTHPERWRYTPAARIKPGNVFERFLVSSFLSPLVFREADIGFGGGVALTDVDFGNNNYREFANILLTYSEEGQQAYRINWSRWLHHRELADGGIIREERGRVYARAGYEKTLTRRFFGIGSRTNAGDETSYTEELTAFGLGVRESLPDVASDWVVRSDLEFQYHNLARGRVIGVPSTDDVFGGVFAQGDGVDQVWTLNSFAWDTRDSQHQPYRGSRIGCSANLALQSGAAFGGRFGGVLGFDAQHVFTLPPLLHRGGFGREENPPTDVFVVNAFVQDTVGDLPYYSLPTLGGTYTLRGYIQGRFADRAAAQLSAEYRVALITRGIVFTETLRIERISLGLFYECGTLADRFDRLPDGKFLDSYGLGLRIGFSREAVFRVDFGFAPGSSNFTLAFGNTF